MRRAAKIARVINNAGLICICSFVAPSEDVREMAKKLIGEDRFVAVYLTVSNEELRRRDAQGVYKKADSGELREFPGVSAPYDVPKSPDLVLETDKLTVDECVDRIMRVLEKKGTGIQDLCYRTNVHQVDFSTIPRP